MDSYPQHTLILRKLGSGLGSGKDYPIIPNLNPYPNPNSNPNPDRESAERRNHPPSDPFSGPVDLSASPLPTLAHLLGVPWSLQISDGSW